MYTYIHNIHIYLYLYIYNAYENIQETRLGVALLSRTTIVARRAGSSRAPNPRDSPVMSDPDVLGRVDRMHSTLIVILVYMCGGGGGEDGLRASVLPLYTYRVRTHIGTGGEGPRVGSGLRRRGMNERWWKAIGEDRVYWTCVCVCIYIRVRVMT